MATKIRIEHISAGYRAVLESPGVSGLVYGKGDQIAAAAGDGFICRHGHGSFGGGRPVAWVGGSDLDAWQREATDKVLTKAVHSMGVG